MFALTSPTNAEISEFLLEQKELPFSYAEVGASQAEIPRDYPINHHRVQLGKGAKIFERAKEAVRRWTMYEIGWAKVFPPNAPIVPGEVVCTVIEHLYIHSLNPCRIIYVIEEASRFGFGFGTLPGHSEEGEERFLVEWLGDDTVWYEILAFARPHHILAKLGFPYVTYLQKQFAADSQRAMQNFARK